jgi:transposase-like protein
LARRHDAVEVIGEALLCSAGEAYRRVAERLGVPAETVRDWRLRFGSRAGLVADHFRCWARALDGALRLPEPQGSPVLDALEAIGCYARAASLSLGRRAPWSWVAALTAGGLLALEINTNPPWPVPE